jgi:hypothetical protein
MLFGETELQVTARDATTGAECSTSIAFAKTYV